MGLAQARPNKLYIYIAGSKIFVKFIFSTADIEGSIIDFKKHKNSVAEEVGR